MRRPDRRRADRHRLPPVGEPFGRGQPRHHPAAALRQPAVQRHDQGGTRGHLRPPATGDPAGRRRRRARPRGHEARYGRGDPHLPRAGVGDDRRGQLEPLRHGRLLPARHHRRGFRGHGDHAHRRPDRAARRSRAVRRHEPGRVRLPRDRRAIRARLRDDEGLLRQDRARARRESQHPRRLGLRRERKPHHRPARAPGDDTDRRPQGCGPRDGHRPAERVVLGHALRTPHHQDVRGARRAAQARPFHHDVGHRRAPLDRRRARPHDELHRRAPRASAPGPRHARSSTRANRRRSRARSAAGTVSRSSRGSWASSARSGRRWAWIRACSSRKPVRGYRRARKDRPPGPWPIGHPEGQAGARCPGRRVPLARGRRRRR